MAYLWKVKAKRNSGKIPAGASVEIIKNGTSAKPNFNEISDAFNNKYGITPPNGHMGDFDIIKG